jgi:hypothetical protein
MIKQAIIDRATWILSHYWDQGLDGEFYLAGGCLANKTINDVDVFPLNGITFLNDNVKIISKTANAITFATKPWPLQTCRYGVGKSLKQLVDSFDYSHIQVGVYVKDKVVADSYYTDEYILSKVSGRTRFLGSEYPLSSLIRAGKYYNQGIMNRHEYIRSVLHSLGATVKRGFKDYNDFKDQLDAVDLGLLPEEMDEVAKTELMALFNGLRK